MNNDPLQSLIGDQIKDAKYIAESKNWFIRFKSGATINIECIWRLLEKGVITSTSKDQDQLFGNQKTFDGEVVFTKISKHEVTAIESVEKTGDINIQFGEYTALQIIADSSGYESWQFKDKDGKPIISVDGQYHSY